jgi:hypothetical protein
VVDATLELKQIYEKAGYEVQTVRLTTQPWEAYCPDPVGLAEKAAALEEVLSASGIDFFSIGTTRRAEFVPALFDVIKKTRTGFCTVLASKRDGIDLDCVREAARLIKRLARGRRSFRPPFTEGLPPSASGWRTATWFTGRFQRPEVMKRPRMRFGI